MGRENFSLLTMSRLVLLLFLTAFVAAQIPEGCVDCGVPQHPNCQFGDCRGHSGSPRVQYTGRTNQGDNPARPGGRCFKILPCPLPKGEEELAERVGFVGTTHTLYVDGH